LEYLADKSERKQSWRTPVNILVRPLSSLEALREEPLPASMAYLLVFGLVTSVIAGVLSSLYGVNYQEPSNCGGSAQIFAHWFTYVIVANPDWLVSALLFIASNEIGYLILAGVSAVVLAGSASLLSDERARSLLAPAMAAVCYGMTPGILFGWIPNPFYLTGVLALIYQLAALWVMMKLTKTRTVVLGILWLVLVGIVQDGAVLIFEMLL
jgi:hypothetical protein